MPSPCHDVWCVFVQAVLFFHFLLFLMPSCSCLTWMPVAKWGGSSGSRETKEKVAMVTEAKENSSSPLSRVPLTTGGRWGWPSSLGAARAFLRARLDSRPSLLAAAESYSVLGYQEWKREVKELRCFLQTGLQVRLDTLLWNCFACLLSYCSFLFLSVSMHVKYASACVWDRAPDSTYQAKL